MLKVVSQLVFNMAASSQACLAYIWESCFPDQLCRAVKLGKGMSCQLGLILLTRLLFLWVLQPRPNIHDTASSLL